MAAPPKPPIRACEELEGRPNFQVMRFQTMAPMRAARMTQTVMPEGSTSPLPMVLATWVPKKKAARKLKAAAHMTALPGDRTRVETTVAMELEASWNPLVKSKIRA